MAEGPWGGPRPSHALFIGLCALAALIVAAIGWLLNGT